MATPITVKTIIKASPEKAWDVFFNPSYITQWCFASPDWHCPKAEGDLRVGGTFSSRMEAKDGSFGFDFGGTYTEVTIHSTAAYILGDERTVKISFHAIGDKTEVTETFDPESENPVEMQQAGWQAILDNYKKVCDAA